MGDPRINRTNATLSSLSHTLRSSRPLASLAYVSLAPLGRSIFFLMKWKNGNESKSALLSRDSYILKQINCFFQF